MLTLAKHIESLLINHDCVVVPGLGGFVTQSFPATYIEKEGAYLPPYRSVSFNSMLAINDGLLIERYQQYENLNYLSALRLLNGHVSELKKRIAEDGEFELIGIGTLYNGEGARLCFKPRPGGIMTPSLYGLEPAYIPALDQLDNSEEQEDVDTFVGEETEEQEEPRHYTLRINREWVNYAVAAVVSVMFYFLVAPFGVSTSDVGYASMAPVVEKRTHVQKHVLVVRNSQPTATAESVTVENKTIDTPVTPVVNERDEYVVVLASMVSKKYADVYVEQLKAKGITSGRIVEKGTMRRVVMGHFSSEQEARSYLHQLTDDEQFADCWVLKVTP